jgi:hypothetical protein
VSDRLDGRFASRTARRLGRVAAAVLFASGCQPLSPAVLPPEAGGGTPCTLDVATRADTVVVSAGICNPGCVRVAAGTPVQLVNQDPYLYLFVGEPPATFQLQLPPGAWFATPPLAAGTWVVSEVHQPATTVTIFAE